MTDERRQLTGRAIIPGVALSVVGLVILTATGLLLYRAAIR
jgi:hypothetical protein